MKPSERIKKLRKNGDIEGHELSVAIMLYLDEEWEKNKLCKTNKCSDPRGNDLCTNGIDTYHEWNIKHGHGCVLCRQKII